MVVLYLLGFAVGLMGWQTPVEADVSTVTLRDGERVDIPLSPSAGEVDARRGNGRTSLEVRLDRTDPLTVFGENFRAYVVWAVSPEGDFFNLGELHLDSRRAELDTTTALQRFGLVITAEPFHSVESPSERIAARSASPNRGNVRSESIRVTVGGHSYDMLDLPPSGSLPPRVIQARAAFQIAEAGTESQFGLAEFRQARVAFDSMEQLLGRSMEFEILEEFVNDSIRLSARAIRAAREERGASELRTVTRRAESAENRIDELQFELQVRDDQVEEVSGRLASVNTERQEARDLNREVTFARDQAERALRETLAELEVERDPWPPLLDALLSAGASQVPRGAQVVLSRGLFEDGEATFAEGTREALSRLVGIVRFGPVPEIRIEGHTGQSGSTADDLALSEDRAEVVREYLLSAGVPPDRVRAQGFGASRPVLGSEDSSDPANERVEITILEP